MNRVLFKQMFQAGAIDFCQLDSARLASINEILAVYLMAKKFGVPVCPHWVHGVRVPLVTGGATRRESVRRGIAAAGDADRILIPVHATARRVSGLNAAAGGLLTNLRVDGDLAYSGGRVLSDNLRLRSDRIDATAIVVANLETGRYTGALKA